MPDRPPRRKQRAQPPIGEHALDEILPQPRIAQPALFFDGQRRHPRAQGGGVKARPCPLGHAARRVHLDPFHAAAGRVSFQDVTREVEPSQESRREPASRWSCGRSSPRRSSARSSGPAHRSPARGVAIQIRGRGARSPAACPSRPPPRDKRAPTPRSGRASRSGRCRACARRRTAPSARAGTRRCRCESDRGNPAPIDLTRTVQRPLARETRPLCRELRRRARPGCDEPRRARQDRVAAGRHLEHLAVGVDLDHPIELQAQVARPEVADARVVQVAATCDLPQQRPRTPASASPRSRIRPASRHRSPPRARSGVLPQSAASCRRRTSAGRVVRGDAAGRSRGTRASNSLG